MKTVHESCPFCGYQWAVVDVDSEDDPSIKCQSCRVKFQLASYEVRKLRDTAVEKELLTKYRKRPGQ